MLGSILFAATVGLSSLALPAQVIPEGRNHVLPPVEASLTYSLARSNDGPGICVCFFMNGDSAETSIRAYRQFSAVVDFTGEHTGNIDSTGEPLSLYTI